MLDANVGSHLLRTVMDCYRKILFAKEAGKENKQKNLWKDSRQILERAD